MEYREEKTIAAVATAPGAAGIAVIRVSGTDAGPIVGKVFVHKGKRPFFEEDSHRIFYGWIKDQTDQRIDEVLVMWMKGPRTFTGEDTVEINCHGGTYVSSKILELLYEAGAEPARPGEFTQRAYLNGKLDLTQAEAVMDIIASETDLSLRASASQLRGSLFHKTEDLREQLMEVMAQAEVNIDYPEYDVPELSVKKMMEACQKICQEAQKLYDTAEAGQIVKNGIRAAIIGAPNVGKSSLLNQLLGQDRAIVTNIPGTTRDTLEETASIGGIALRLVDTAGIRHTEDAVERIGVDRAKQTWQESDLILFVVDSTRSIKKEEDELFAAIQEKPYLILLNKTDVGTMKPEEVAEHWKDISREIFCRILPISAKEGQGMERVAESIRSMFLQGLVVTDHTPMITNLRQKQALMRALEALTRAVEAGQSGFEEDLLMMDVNEAYDALGEISGHSVKEDMVQEIFRRFCLGK